MASHLGIDLAATARAPTGISGLDVATQGGLPLGRTTLIEGGPGAGKTVLALQSMVHAARALDEPGIFVAFEEDSTSIVRHAAPFGWDLPALKKKLVLIDARPTTDLVQSGAFDLSGMLALLEARIEQVGARRITFDAIDVVLSLLGSAAAERQELYRLHDWLLARELTAIITCKASRDGSSRQSAGFIQFMVDCAITLDHRIVRGISQRSLRVLKFRGSDFHENEAPYVIAATGLDVAFVGNRTGTHAPVSSERVSTGVARLDTMLGGGLFRGASILVTGAPGTAKTTLCGAFAEAACLRGESTLYVSFDSDTGEVVRNLSSVGIRLDRHIGKGRRPGLLGMFYARALDGSAETHLLHIQAMARAQGARCLVVDPMSAIAQSGNEDTAHSVAERLIDWTKREGITSFCTSLLDDDSPGVESSALQISTIADTWIHLSYHVDGGERNRGLSIVKSRGTAHSNQVRELLLGERGVTLADAYTAGGEVLMGTLRWEREQAEAASRRKAEEAERDGRIGLLTEEADLAASLAALQRKLDAKRAALKALTLAGAVREDAVAGRHSDQRSLRSADAEPARKKRVAR